MKQHKIKLSIDQNLWESFVKASRYYKQNEFDYLEEVLKASVYCTIYDGLDLKLPERLQERL